MPLKLDSAGTSAPKARPTPRPVATGSRNILPDYRYTPVARPAPTYTQRVQASRPMSSPQPTYRSSSSGSSSGGGGGYSEGSYDSGGGGGGGGMGGGAASAPAIVAAPPEPPPPPPPIMETITIPDAKEDLYYKQKVGDLARALTDFKAQQGLARGQYDTGWTDAKRRMGWDETGGMFDRGRPGAYGESVEANENDFAGRGLLRSGAYVKSMADIDRDFNDRRTSLDTARNDNVNTQTQALGSFTGSQDSARNAAMSDAVARIASKYGIELSAVPQGKTSTITREKV